MNEPVPSENNREFFKGLDEQMEGAAPGLPEKLEKLNREKLGRAIVIEGKKGGDELAAIRDLTKAIKTSQSGAPSFDQEAQNLPDESKDYLIGYVLPAQSNQEKHVMIFKTGDIFVTAPPENGYLHSKENYIEEFSPNDEPIKLGSVYGKNVAGVLEGYFKHYVKFTLSNKNPNDLPQISETIKQALVIAKELKTTREKAKQESIKSLTSQLDSFFDNGKQGPSTGQTPPPTPPSSGPGPNSAL
jgi:hypothetical protein